MKETVLIPDLKERASATDPGGSFIVQAPAGSGKTTLLIQRYLVLLATVDKPEEILAITFTRKAAGEMRARIVEAMEMAGSGAAPADPGEARTIELAQKVLERDRARGWRLLENTARLKVLTIDSFCASITRQMPLLSGLGRQLSVSESPDELYEEAARRTLSLIDRDGRKADALRLVLRHMDNSVGALSKKLVDMLRGRDQWLRHVEGGIGDAELRTRLEQGIKNLVEERLRLVSSVFPEDLAAMAVESGRYAGDNLRAASSPSVIAGLAGIKEMPRPVADDLESWQGLANLLLTGKGEWRKAGGGNKNIGFPPGRSGNEAELSKQAFQGLLEEFEGLDSVAEALYGVGKLPAPAYSDGEWLVLSALTRLLPVAVARLEEVFAERETVDFSMVSMAAIEALGPDDAPTDLMLAFDNRFRHILVDEYQDTSWTQATLLRALTRGWEQDCGRTLFIVGDPMQSIYRFRDADVGIFLEVKQSGMAGIGLTPLQLKANFRSRPAIVDWVNRVFDEAFPADEDPVTGAVGYSESRGVRLDAAGAGVELFIYSGRDDNREAQDVLRVLRSLPEGESKVVLVRSRAHLIGIVEALKAAGIDYRGEQLEPLGERVVIKELTALLRALLHPCDRVAWLALLRARFCGLSLVDIHGLTGSDHNRPLWGLLNDDGRIGELSGEGQSRVVTFREKMAKAMALRGRVPVRALLEGLWIALGGPACFSGDDDMQDAETFFDLVSESGIYDSSSLKWLEKRVDKLFAMSSGKGANPVVLMTIHKAKGLEFDNVILPGAGKKSGSSERRIMQWLERGRDLLLAPIEEVTEKGRGGLIYNCISGINRRKEEYEDLRLFYVAATRARERLYLFGDLNKDAAAVKGSFLSLIDPGIYEDNIIELSEPDYSAADQGNGAGAPALYLKRLPAGWEGPCPRNAILTGAKTEKSHENSQGPAFDWAGEEARHLGTVIHRYLCRIAREGLDRWGSERLGREARHMATMLREMGFGSEEARSLAGKGIGTIGKALASERGRWVLGGHAEGSAEMAVSAVIDGSIRRTVIDRSFVDKDNVRWIVDYKTGSHEGGSLENFLADEKERYAPQLDGYEQALRKAGEGREIRKALYYPAIDGWVEWQG